MHFASYRVLRIAEFISVWAYVTRLNEFRARVVGIGPDKSSHLLAVKSHQGKHI